MKIRKVEIDSAITSNREGRIFLCKYKNDIFVSRIKNASYFGYYVDSNQEAVPITSLDEIYEIEE